MNTSDLEVTTSNMILNGNFTLPKPAISREVLNITLSVTIAIMMVGMGCGVELEKLKKHLKRPIGVVVGAVCQFVIMPVIAFTLAKIFQMGELQTLALLLIGSAPGGTTSNAVTVWIDGDMDLSVSMTTVSSILGFGMMPLLLWIYQFGFSFSLNVPFQTIGITLASLLVPIAVGMLIRFKFPRQANIILRVLSVVGLLAIITVAVISIVTYNGVFVLTAPQYICAAIFPAVGMTLGYGLSSLVSLYRPFRLHHNQRRTISIETGIQNTQLAIAIIQLSGFNIIQVGQMVLFPVIYLASQLVWVVIAMIAYKVYRRVKSPQVLLPDKQREANSEKEDEVSLEGRRNPVYVLDDPPEYESQSDCSTKL